MRERSVPGNNPTPSRRKGCCGDLRLCVAGTTPCFPAAYENIRMICEEYAGGRGRITMIDLIRNPAIACSDGITAIPTRIRLSRAPGRRKIIGNLSETIKVPDGLDLPEKMSSDYRATTRPGPGMEVRR